MSDSNMDCSVDNTIFSNVTMFGSGPTATDEPEHANETEELRRKIEAQEEHELICLEGKQDKIVLTEGKAFLSYWNDYNNTLPRTTATINVNENVYVISFLGDTASGKSFLANHLFDVQSIVFGEYEHSGSTTANVTCFESNSILNTEKNNCFVLDFEGENGSWFPRLLKRFAEYIFSADEPKYRREAVEKYFPTLAYLLSNVIILMGQDDLFCNSRYIQRVEKFTAKAVNNVQQNIYKPVLILVQNKYPGENILSPKEATRKFFNAHPDAKKLLHFFSEICCLVLPFKRTETTPNINEKFDAQVVILRKLLTVMCKKHQSHLLPHLPWLLLTRHVIEKVSKNETIMKHMVLQNIFIKKQSKGEDSIILFLFNKLYGKINIHSTRWFHRCREFAIELLARSIAIRCQYRCERIAEFIKKECESRLTELWKLLDECRPCEALYMGRGYVKERNRPVFCYQHKGVHESKHQTSENVHGGTWLRELVERFIEWPTIDIWDGSFTSDDRSSNVPGDDMHRKLLETTNEYLNQIKQNDRGVYTTFKRLLEKWDINIEFEHLYNWNICFCCSGPIKVNDETEYILSSSICSACERELRVCPQDIRAERAEPLLTASNQEECVICMSSKREVSFIPCGHYFYCEPCANKIFSHTKICAVCKQVVEKIQKIYTP